MPSATSESLQKFVVSCADLKDEKSDAQTFLNRFFQAFGYEDADAAGAVMKKCIKKGSKSGKTGFADLVWTPPDLPGVVIVMKKKGEDLSKHYAQALQYWTYQAPQPQPKYVVLCNFDQFWIYDFNIQVDTPVDMVSLAQFVDRAPSAFAFMESATRQPVFQNNQQEITEKAMDLVGGLCQILKARGKRDSFDDLAAQRFVLQCVLAMFADAFGLLPRDMFVGCVQECLSGARSYDVLGGLFLAMNTPGKMPSGRYKDVECFYSGLLERVPPIELTENELQILDLAARMDWRRVRPAIFGNIFEGTACATARRKHGMHYTSEVDVMKVVRPTISRYWEERIEAAVTIGDLNHLQLELQNYRVLDPACGSGNFLYLAYLELKRIERLLIAKIATRRKGSSEQMAMGFVTPLQFFGIDLNPFAVELARVTLMIARKIENDKFGIFDQPALPLNSLDQNIICADALFTEWPKADAIIGNPPFLGGSRFRKELGDDYTEKVYQKFPEVKGQIDFCIYWFRIAHQNLPGFGRAGLIATHTIRQGQNKVAALDYILNNKGHIHDAVSSQVWSGDADLHVSIINWGKQIADELFLDNQPVPKINSTLKETVDTSSAEELLVNKSYCFGGVAPNGKNFIVTDYALEWISKDSQNKEVLKLFSMGENLANSPNGQPVRWIIDFKDLSMDSASVFVLPFNHAKEKIKPVRQESKYPKIRDFWWLHGDNCLNMRKALSKLNYCFAAPRVSKWGVFIPFHNDWLPGNNSVVVATEDFYIFGILTSNAHRIWMHARKTSRGTSIDYTLNTCFGTFPFPQTPNQKQITAIRQAAIDLHTYRSQQMEKKKCGVTKLYNEYFHEPTSQLTKLHKAIDDLTLQAYGFNKNDDLLEKLLALNLELAAKEKQGEAIVGPWAPDNPPIL